MPEVFLWRPPRAIRGGGNSGFRPDCTLGERDEAGTGLNIGPNALKALRQDGGLCLDALRAASLPWRRWMIALTDGTRLMDLDLLDVADEPGLRIRWADLYAVLRGRKRRPFTRA